MPNGHQHSEPNSSLGTQCLNLHALGEQRIEEVTDVDTVRTTPEECLGGEHLNSKPTSEGGSDSGEAVSELVGKNRI